MFSPQQLAYLKALARQSAGNTLISYNHSQLLVRIGKSEADREDVGAFFFLAGIFLLFIFLIALVVGDWLGIGLVMLFAAGMGGLAWWQLDSRTLASRKPPVFVFDAVGRCFYLLAPDFSQRTSYASRLLTGSRVRILSSTAYFDDTIIELRFGEGAWIQAIRMNTSSLAYELRRAIQLLAEA